MCRYHKGDLQYFLVHPGGPFFRNKDAGAWSIPKGLQEAGEPLAETARREFMEETGIAPTGALHDIGTIKQKSGKQVHAWTFLGEWDPATGITCNSFTLEWPPRSGRQTKFPEVDKAMWMDYDAACIAILPEQLVFLLRARDIFASRPEK